MQSNRMVSIICRAMIPFSILCIRAADATIGRFDESLMSDQCRMEMLIDGLNDEGKKLFLDSEGNYRDISDWKGIRSDPDGRVHRIAFCTSKWEGKLQLDFLPPALNTLKIRSKDTKFKIGGTLSARRLPRGLKELTVNAQAFDGTIDFNALPTALRTFDSSGNFFNGSCALRALPPNLDTLSLQCNQFSGSVDLSSLPHKLTSLILSDNNFSGEIQLRNLPLHLSYVNIANNAFCGRFVLEESVCAREVHASRNKFAGTAVVCGECIRVSLNGNAIVAVVNADNEQHQLEKTILSGRWNRDLDIFDDY